MMDEAENLRKKLERALSLRNAGERLLKKSASNEQSLQNCYKTLVLTSRRVNHYEKQLESYNRKEHVSTMKPLGSGCSAMVRLSIPLILSEQFKTRRLDIKTNIHAYVEAVYNDDFFQSELIEIDQNLSQIVTFNLELNDIDPLTVIKLSIYSWCMKLSDQKKSFGSKKTWNLSNINDSTFDLFGIYEATIISLVKNNYFEFEVINPENPLSLYMEYNQIASALVTIFPDKSTKLYSKNKVVVITVKEILNMDEEGDEFSFLTLYWNVDNGYLKFYFDMYLSKCLESLTTSFSEIECVSINEIENELIITSTTHVITLLIENTTTLNHTLEIFEKIITIGQSWPSSLITFPRSSLCFLKGAITSGHSFFDTIGNPVVRQSSNF